MSTALTTPHTLRLDRLVIKRRRKKSKGEDNVNCQLIKSRLIKSSLIITDSVKGHLKKNSGNDQEPRFDEVDEMTTSINASGLMLKSQLRVGANEAEEYLCKRRESAKEWREAMRKMVRMPNGLPSQMRMRIWKNLADQYIEFSWLDWDHIKQVSFNPTINPDDLVLDQQIVKDLHRTGCDQLGSEVDRVTLKRVLLAYARWNKRVGYCQGLNIIAAIILEVTNKDAELAFKILVFLVDSILPDAFFARNLQALSVDMFIFRNLLQKIHPELFHHLDHLKERSSCQIDQQLNDDRSSGRRSFEPPLSNMYTMQWYLTLFATNLPRETVLHLWDAILLEGSEVYIRCSLAIFLAIADDLLKVTSADMFYMEMSRIVIELAEGKILSRTELMRKIYSFGQFPMFGLKELREKYLYNVSPFLGAMDIHDDDCILSEQFCGTTAEDKKRGKKLLSLMRKNISKRKSAIEVGFQELDESDDVFLWDEPMVKPLAMTETGLETKITCLEIDVQKEPKALKITDNWHLTMDVDENFIMKTIDEKKQNFQRRDRKWSSMMLNEKQGEYQEIFARRIVSVDLERDPSPSSESSVPSLNSHLKFMEDISPGPISEVRENPQRDFQSYTKSKKSDLAILKRNYHKNKLRPRNINLDIGELFDSMSSDTAESFLTDPIPLANQSAENIKIKRLAQKYQNELQTCNKPVNHLLLGNIENSEIKNDNSETLNIMQEWQRRNENVQNFVSTYTGTTIISDNMPQDSGSDVDFPKDHVDDRNPVKLVQEKSPPWLEAINICAKQRPLKKNTNQKAKVNSLQNDYQTLAKISGFCQARL